MRYDPHSAKRILGRLITSLRTKLQRVAGVPQYGVQMGHSLIKRRVIEGLNRPEFAGGSSS